MKMVSRITAIGLAGVAICYLGLSGYVWYHDNKRSKQADVQASAVSENNKVLGFLREKGCDYCHTPSAELPAYYYIPGAKQLMDYDIKLGYKSFNLEAVRAALLADKPVSQSDLNKIEWVMQYETMPPTRYTALHWAGKVSDEERAEILAWIAKQRAEYYASNDTAPEHRNEPVQPIPQKLPTDAQKVALGFALYHDPRLSADSTLQDQAGGPPLNPIEMASKSWDEIIAKLEKDPQLKTQFLEVYPQGFSGENITDAIAEFEKTLITPDSPFDKWLRGDENALTAQQKKGYQLFKDNKCATCHGGIILGGRSFEPLGLKKDFNFGEITAADIGRMNVTKEARDKLRQKVPGLRNVALTAPYFHRGDVPTLDGAVKLMLRYQVGKELPQEDVDDIVAFLHSLNGVYTPYMQDKQ